MALTEPYQITEGARTCSRCGRPFGEKQAFFSTLRDENDELARQDFCAACWEGLDTEPFFSHWQTHRPPEDDSTARVDTHAMLDAFEGMREPKSAQEKSICFVLALFLARRKALKMVGMGTEGGRDCIVFRYPRTQKRVAVEDTHLSEEQIAQTTEQLKALLEAHQ